MLDRGSKMGNTSHEDCRHLGPALGLRIVEKTHVDLSGTVDSLRDSVRDRDVGDVGAVGEMRDDRRSYRHVFSSYVPFSGSLWLS